MTNDCEDPGTRLGEVVKRYLKSEAPADIAARLSLPPAEVNRLIGIARRRWGEALRSRRAENQTIVTDLETLALRFESEWGRRGPVFPEGPPHTAPGVDRSLADVHHDHSHLLAVAGVSLLMPLVSEGAPSEAGAPSPAVHDDVAALSLEEVELEISRLAHGLGLGKEKTPR